jgi:hypothetical protein
MPANKSPYDDLDKDEEAKWHREVNRLVFNSLGPDDEHLALDIEGRNWKQEIVMRKTVSEEVFNSVEGAASVYLSCVPGDSLEEIKRKVSRRDPQGILSYADCLMYGFKRCPIDEAKAIKLYRQAAELNSPEAMVHMAQLSYFKIKKYYRMDPKRYYVNVPVDCVYTSQLDNLRQMWLWLNKSAELNWVSIFLRMSWTDEKKKHGLQYIPPSVNYLILQTVKQKNV